MNFSPGYKLGAKWRETVRCSAPGGYCCDVSHYQDAISLGGAHGSYRWQGQRDDSAAIAADGSSEDEEEGEEEEEMGRRWWRRKVEVQDRGITKACRPSFVAGALTANSKLR